MNFPQASILTTLILTPFGSISDHIRTDRPWIAFDDQSPVLVLVRAQKAAAKSCEAWQDAVVSVPAEEFTPIRGLPIPGGLFDSWEPWTKDDLDPISHCDGFPCDVKLNRGETAAMAKTPEKGRKREYFSLIEGRAERYERTGERKEYEFPGDPTDPWKWFDEHGYRPAMTRPGTVTLFLRKFGFSPGKMLTSHQVVDRRAARSPKDAAVWIRDAYTDHYFDSWGEWDDVSCDPQAQTAIVVQAVLVELDFLKKTGIFARSLRGRYKDAFKDVATRYLNRQFESYQRSASRGAP